MVTTEEERHELRVTLEISQDRTLSSGLIPAEEQCLFVFDSRFHFDRTAEKLMDGDDISLEKVDRLLAHSLIIRPSHPVKLVNAAMVFSHGKYSPYRSWIDRRWLLECTQEGESMFRCTSRHDEDFARFQSTCDGVGTRWPRQNRTRTHLGTTSPCLQTTSEVKLS